MTSTTGDLLPNHTLNDYDHSNIPWLKNASTTIECPPELAIIVHGWSLNETKAIERFDRANMSLQRNNYRMPVVGFSWDSNTGFQWVNAGWTVANLIAKENGPKLAQFIIDYNTNCTDSDVRIIAHSLGSRVTLSALDNLYRNQKWNNGGFKISSVHFVGVAIAELRI